VSEHGILTPSTFYLRLYSRDAILYIVEYYTVGATYSAPPKVHCHNVIDKVRLYSLTCREKLPSKVSLHSREMLEYCDPLSLTTVLDGSRCDPSQWRKVRWDDDFFTIHTAKIKHQVLHLKYVAFNGRENSKLAFCYSTSCSCIGWSSIVRYDIRSS